MKFDNLLKTLFQEAMPGLLRALNCAPVVDYLTVEFPARPKLVADVVAPLADGKILHIEFQLTCDPRMRWRRFHYFGAIQEQWEDSEVIQFVIYLGNGPMTMASQIEKPSCRYRFEILDMREIPARVFLDSPNDAERVSRAALRFPGSKKHHPQRPGVVEALVRQGSASQHRAPHDLVITAWNGHNNERGVTSNALRSRHQRQRVHQGW